MPGQFLMGSGSFRAIGTCFALALFRCAAAKIFSIVQRHEIPHRFDLATNAEERLKQLQ